MPPKTPDDQAPEKSRPSLGQWRRSLAGAARSLLAWAKANRLRAALAAGTCLMLIAGSVVAWSLTVRHRSADEFVTFEMALSALDSGAYVQAREWAEKLRAQGTLPPEELGGPVFVLGAAAAHEADHTWSSDKTDLYLVAARYLEEARDRGFPPGRRGEGLYLLGRSLYLSGQIPASRPALRSALRFNKENATEIHRLLAGAYLGDANPRLEEALQENSLYLSDPALSQTVRHQGLLERAQILLRLERIAECMATLDTIPSEAENYAEAIVMRGQLLMHEARTLKDKREATAEDELRAEQKYQAAIKTLRLARGRDTLSTQATRKAMYLIGVCLLEMGGPYNRAALSQFERTSKLFPDTPEGFAASFQEAELSRQLGRDAQAAGAYRRVLRAVTDPENFSNPWITLDELRARMLSAYRHYLKTQSFKNSLELTQLFFPLFTRVRTLELSAEARRSWGGAMLAQATHLPPGEAESTRRLGRAQFRLAGGVYWRLAQLQVATRKYPDQLWNTADAYLKGQDYRHAVLVLRKYLKNETRRRHAQALVDLGEALLAMDRMDEALDALRECVHLHPRDAAAFRARLVASRAFLEKGDLPQAETLVRENLNGEHGLTPDSTEWRDSLFALGTLLRFDGRYEEAIRRLEEAIERYPDCAQALQARYLIADSYRQSAAALRNRLEQTQAGTARAAQSKQIRQLLDKALDQYRQLRDLLGHRRETAELPPVQQSILRNCYFAVGDVLFDLGQYEEAIQAFSVVTNRYQHRPEVLEAYVQIAAAYRRLDKPVEARATLEQAKVVLGRMKTEAKFKQTTNYTRKQWSERLDWLASL